MLGAYFGIILLGFFTAVGLTAFSLPLSIGLTLLLTIIFCSSYGFTIEKLAYKPLRKAPRLSPLISAIGVSIFLQNYVMLTQGATDKVFPEVVAGHRFFISFDEDHLSSGLDHRAFRCHYDTPSRLCYKDEDRQGDARRCTGQDDGFTGGHQRQYRHIGDIHYRLGPRCCCGRSWWRCTTAL